MTFCWLDPWEWISVKNILEELFREIVFENVRRLGNCKFFNKTMIKYMWTVNIFNINTLNTSYTGFCLVFFQATIP